MIGPELQLRFNLSPDEVAALESRVAATGGDCHDRATLAVHYGRIELEDASAAATREGHLLWLANHCPRHDQKVLFAFIDEPPAALVEAWDAHVDAHPDEPVILANVAALRRGHDAEGALALYAHAEDVDPTNPRWPESQAHLLSLRARFGRLTHHEDAAAAYAKLQRAAALSDDERRYDLLAGLAEAAWEAGDAQAARAHAREALSRVATMPLTWNTGNLIHDAHATLGRVALAENNLPAARAHLLEAGRTPGSPQLDSFGPDLQLAAELLAHGEHATVLQYLDLCARFWKDADDLDQWREQLRRGETPDLR